MTEKFYVFPFGNELELVELVFNHVLKDRKGIKLFTLENASDAEYPYSFCKNDDLWFSANWNNQDELVLFPHNEDAEKTVKDIKNIFKEEYNEDRDIEYQMTADKHSYDVSLDVYKKAVDSLKAKAEQVSSAEEYIEKIEEVYDSKLGESITLTYYKKGKIMSQSRSKELTKKFWKNFLAIVK